VRSGGTDIAACCGLGGVEGSGGGGGTGSGLLFPDVTIVSPPGDTGSR